MGGRLGARLGGGGGRGWTEFARWGWWGGGVRGWGGGARLLGMGREPCVYILASRPHGAIYTGVTSDLVRRVWQHKRGVGSAFTKRYQIDKLVWMELHASMGEAIAREKQIKRWSKARRRGLVDAFNPEWRDLYFDLA